MQMRYKPTAMLLILMALLTMLTVAVHAQGEEYLVTVTSCVDGAPRASVATLTGGGAYIAGEEAVLTAPAVAGYAFKGWYASDGQGNPSGEALSTEQHYAFAAQADADFVAVYQSGQKFRLRVYGSGYKVNDRGPKVSDTLMQMKAGEQVSLEYVGGDAFLHWKNGADKIISTGGSYAFTMVAPADCIAVTAESCAEEGRSFAFVEFVTSEGQILEADTWYSDDDPQSHRLPAAPAVEDMCFEGWSMDGESVCTAQEILSAVDGSSTYLCVQALYSELYPRLTVTVKNNVDEEELRFEGKRGKIVSLQAAEKEGYVFTHWSLDKAGKACLSAQKSYEMTASHDLTIYAHYVQSGTAFEKAPGMVEITGMHIQQIDHTQYQFEMYVTCSETEGYAQQRVGLLIGHGDVTDRQSAVQDMVLENTALENISLGSGLSRFGCNMDISAEELQNEEMLWLRAYMQVLTPEGGTITVYSHVEGTTYAELLRDGYVPDVDLDGTGENETPIVPIDPNPGEGDPDDPGTDDGNETPIVPIDPNPGEGDPDDPGTDDGNETPIVPIDPDQGGEDPDDDGNETPVVPILPGGSGENETPIVPINSAGND